jgi:hypothetical protein
LNRARDLIDRAGTADDLRLARSSVRRALVLLAQSKGIARRARKAVGDQCAQTLSDLLTDAQRRVHQWVRVPVSARSQLAPK